MPHEWAEKYRTLFSEDQCAEPGPWNNDRTPFLVAIMDMGEIDGWVRKLVIKKAARLGVSEASRNTVGCRQDTKPGPAMFVNATRGKTEEVQERQYVPLFERNARLSRLYRGRAGWTIKLDKTVIDLGWPNSPIMLADRSIRDIIADECNKFPGTVKTEAGPIELMEVRLDTYYDQSFFIILSSPTHSNGIVSREHKSAPARLVCQVPCPGCGKYQVYDFEQIKWPTRKGALNKDLASEIQETGSAWYQCKHCKAKWTDAQKHAIVLKCVYTFEGETVTEADITAEHKALEDRLGRKVARRYNHVIWKGRRPPIVGVQMSGILSPWRSYSRFAAEYLRSVDDPIKMQNFRNSWLGEDYEFEAAEVKETAFDQKIKIGGDRLKVPKWASCLVATADTQKEYFYYNIRAWGAGYRSQLVDQGLVQTFDELRLRCLDTEYEVDEPGWGTITPLKLFIDAGGGKVRGEDTTRTWEVYQFALEDLAGRIIPVHGHGGSYVMHEPFQMRHIDYTPPDQKHLPKSMREVEKVQYLRINTGQFKDLLAARIQHSERHPAYWGLHNQRDRDYIAQMCSEHKVLVGQGAKQEFQWQTKTTGADNHQWDNEVYQCAGAQYLRIDKIPPIGDIIERERVAESYRTRNNNQQAERPRRW